ncbi:MAG: hypothetical protein EPO28_18280 [Saprospiraceae bacterium]|nr:MAG: hypothetical protein EPO28_18280 [Saprospiraceae bacterium]
MANTPKLLLRGRNGVEIEVLPGTLPGTLRQLIAALSCSASLPASATICTSVRWTCASNSTGWPGWPARSFPQEVMSGGVFIFINRRRDRIKLLMWYLTGFALYYKRLKTGTFEWPLIRTGENSVELAWPELVKIGEERTETVEYAPAS